MENTSQSPIATPPPPSPQEIPEKKPIQWKMWILIASIVVASLASLLYFYVLKLPPSKPIAPAPSPTPAQTQNSTANWKTYSSDCNFQINYPTVWNIKKFFFEDTPNSCAYITAPDYKEFQPHGREGFHIEITRIQKGSTLDNQIIYSLDDYIKFQNNATGSFIEVKNKKNKTIGSFIGKEFEPIGEEFQTEFIFEKTQYVYSIIWPSEYREEYKSGYKGNYHKDLESILSSITF